MVRNLIMDQVLGDFLLQKEAPSLEEELEEAGMDALVMVEQKALAETGTMEVPGVEVTMVEGDQEGVDVLEEPGDRVMCQEQKL